MSNQNQTVAQALAAPFPTHDIEWRIQSSGVKADGTIWAKVLAYVTARAIMDRLDLVFGPFGWQDSYAPGPAGGVVCKLSVFSDGRWVTKEDGAENTDIEEVKGGISGALKRAAVKWGIGRYLYRLEEGWATIGEHGAYSAKTKDGKWFKWSPPELPAWAVGDGKPYVPPTTVPAQTAAPAPHREATPPPATQTPANPAQTGWRAMIIPPFIKKYAGRTLGDMAEKDLAWWAANYEPRPYKGAISPKDTAFKAALVEGASELTGAVPATAAAKAADDASYNKLANKSEGADEDVPFN